MTTTGIPVPSRPTIIWGVAADAEGLVHRSRVLREDLAGGQYRAWQEEEWKREPATAYASEHPAPMPLRWSHGEQIGQVLALRRSDGRLSAVAETELEPDDLQALVEEHGDLKWSTGTLNGRREPLRIRELSLTPSPASVGLWAVRWYKPGVSKGNLPGIVKQDLERARKTEFRSRGVLRVFEGNGGAPVGDNFERALVNPREVFHSGTAGQILSVGGKPVRR